MKKITISRAWCKASCIALYCLFHWGALCADDGGIANESALWHALRSGTLDFSLRWRYEHVQDDLLREGIPLKDASASTARATLGYRTAALHTFAAYLQFEAIGAIGIDDYYDGSGIGNKRFATVVDPEGTEINQGYISWRPTQRFDIKAGRQIVTYRDAPFHRYMGTVLWRQNWQTHDAITLGFEASKNLTVRYAYTWNINRIFGEDAPEPLSDFDSNSHLVNVIYTGVKNLRLEAYAYLLDFDNAVRFSSNTFGVRGSGMYPLDNSWGLLYAVEFAHQSEGHNNPFSYSEDYVALEGGLRWNLATFVQSLALKLSYELLGGDGATNGAFVTILGTNHAFQGWADRFLVTPDTGIEDLYATFIAAMPEDLNFVASYHNLKADGGGFDYGEEFDLMLTKKFLKHYLIGTKVSFYLADKNRRNINGDPSADVTKLWMWAGFKF